MSSDNPEFLETTLKTQQDIQSQAQAHSEQSGDSWATYYQGFFKATPKKEKEDLSYRERHAVRHIRHRRDEEYNKLAFKLCDSFTQNYATCVSGNQLSAAWACRKPLQELKACVNRQLLQFRENEGEINSLPAAPNEHVDYDTILEQFYTAQEMQNQQKQQ